MILKMLDMEPALSPTREQDSSQSGVRMTMWRARLGVKWGYHKVRLLRLGFNWGGGIGVVNWGSSDESSPLGVN